MTLGEAVLPQSCKDAEDRFYSKETQRCCYRCPTGFTPKTKCPTDRQSDCEKQCGPDQFLNYEELTPRCQDCLTCNSERNLVQKAPCTHNSSRVCMCKHGLYCQTSIPNTCARCSPLTTCKPGFGVKIRGTSEEDTVCEKCPPRTFSEADSSTETCQPRRVNTRPEKLAEKQENSARDQLGLVSSNILDTVTTQPMNKSNNTGIPDIMTQQKILIKEEKDFTLLAVALLFTLLLCAGLVMLWKKRVCKKWTVPHKVTMSNQAKISATGEMSPTEGSQEEMEMILPESLANASSSGSLSETEETSSLDSEGAELLQVDGGVLVEPAVRSHTSNCIEKIYIMRADTVIVGSVSEVPNGKACPARGEEGTCGAQEEAEETEVVMHYPEQETAFSPKSDITTPVEEEWEFPRSVLANEKPLEIREESLGGAS
ncbi:tumor necrosis factor receptor superfamily member 8 [Eublepharis macularius]|uniref:Tumor necrosis factor receptor superfamily member 8 n=1 Tax=Eublepharis macularius TaxID=481883 RepID=A0AA97KJC2_EUBMA|nr:tumor necrosis factor receptor superfamily member 8 [Eublepharis macularius]